ncbi:MAG: hypothetical protein NC918_04500 [Candidatus Omnitrophica bacterium]|nr:hypothetical protein [Candidatus Omnitrophota bacterium]
MVNFKIVFFIFFLISFVHINFCSKTSGLANLTSVVQSFCADIYELLPPISMLLVIAAALTFAAGQLASAETRARATSWATAMVVGALFGFIIVTIIPSLIMYLYQGGGQGGDWTQYCKKS